MVVLRKCPKCRETVNAQSVICPRCGVNFREHRVRRVIFWISAAAAVVAGFMIHAHVAHRVPSNQPTPAEQR